MELFRARMSKNIGDKTGNMKMMKKATLTSILFLMLSVSVLANDNEIYVDQSGASSTIKIEQINGSGNIIGGLQSTAGSLTPFDIDGTSQILLLDGVFRPTTDSDVGVESPSGFISPPTMTKPKTSKRLLFFPSKLRFNPISLALFGVTFIPVQIFLSSSKSFL